MAALADNGQAQEPLGSLLVKRGLITPEQLEVALQEQKTSGEPLGAIVVARGFAAPATVAQALATQHGGLLKTEYGFATGFSSGGLQTAGVVGEPPVSSPRLGRAGAVVSITEAKPKADPVADREAVREELSMASAETEKLAEANERLVAARAELEQRLAQESQRAASLEAELETLRTGDEDLTKWQDAVAQWQAAYGELEQRLTDRDTELVELRSSIEACDTVRTELERGLATEVERSEALKQELALVEGRRADAESADSERVALEEKLAEVTARAEALESEAAAARELGESASNGVRAELESKLAQADEQLQAAEVVRADLERRVAEATERAGGLETQAEEAEALRRSALASEQTIGRARAAGCRRIARAGGAKRPARPGDGGARGAAQRTVDSRRTVGGRAEASSVLPGAGRLRARRAGWASAGRGRVRRRARRVADQPLADAGQRPALRLSRPELIPAFGATL